MNSVGSFRPLTGYYLEFDCCLVIPTTFSSACLCFLRSPAVERRDVRLQQRKNVRTSTAFQMSLGVTGWLLPLSFRNGLSSTVVDRRHMKMMNMGRKMNGTRHEVVSIYLFRSTGTIVRYESFSLRAYRTTVPAWVTSVFMTKPNNQQHVADNVMSMSSMKAE